MEAAGTLIATAYQGVDGLRREAEHPETTDVGDDVNGRLVIIPYGEASGQEKTYLCIAKNYLRSEGYEQAFIAGV